MGKQEERPNGEPLKARAVGGEGDGDGGGGGAGGDDDEGALVDMSRIEADIRKAREAIAANRREIEDLKAGRLSVQSLEALLTDIGDIWTNTGQLVGLERQQRNELRIIADAQRDMVEEVRALRSLLEQRNTNRDRWRALLRRRRAEPGDE